MSAVKSCRKKQRRDAEIDVSKVTVKRCVETMQDLIWLLKPLLDLKAIQRRRQQGQHREKEKNRKRKNRETKMV